MDHEEEQQMELEALEAILSDQLKEFDGTIPSAWSSRMRGKVYKVVLTPDEDMESKDYPMKLEFSFAHTEAYPEEAPHTRVRSVMGMSDSAVKEGEGIVQGVIDENLGMAMIYQIVTELQEWLNNKSVESGGGAKVGDEEALRIAQEKAEAERAAARAIGTPVSTETFREWKLHFDAEMESKREGVQQDDGATRMTGKQYFLQNEKTFKDIDQDDLDAVDDETLAAEQVDVEPEEQFDEDDLDEDFDEDEDDDDEDDVLEAYLAQS